MSRSRTFKEDPELAKLREAEQKLLLLEKEYAQIPKKLAQELKDRECTMPPLPEIEDRRRQRVHEDTVSRGEASNILRDQTRSLILTAMLLVATGALIWWGVKLMQG
jgi:hypothetical protein